MLYYSNEFWILKSFPLACRARWDESIDIWHQRIKIKMKSHYIRLNIVVQTDGRNRFRNVGTVKDLSNDIWHFYQSWKLVGDEENNIPPPLH